MSYPRGKMDKRVAVYAPVRQQGAYGQGAVKYQPVATLWAWVTWVRGARALHHGGTDIYQTVMVRCDISRHITAYSRLQIGEKYYVIDSINTSQSANECQLTAFEVENINQTVSDHGNAL